MVRGKRAGTHIVLSVLGIENENDLTDLMAVDPQDKDSMEEGREMYVRKRVRVGRQGGSWVPENIH
jgi:hypothetical protein